MGIQGRASKERLIATEEMTRRSSKLWIWGFSLWWNYLWHFNLYCIHITNNKNISNNRKNKEISLNITWNLKNLQNNALCDLSAVSSGAVPLTYCSKLINEENWLKQFIPFHYEALRLYLFPWLTLPIITVWHIGPSVNSLEWVHALLTGGLCNSVAQMRCQPIKRQEKGPGRSKR